MNAMTETIKNPLRQAQDLGQSIWYDGLATPEEFKKMILEDDVRGVTTNPSIFEKSIAANELGAGSAASSADEWYKALAIKAVQDLADVFLPVYEKTSGKDGFVSIEVSPLLANDTQGTIAEAKELHRRVNRRNALIKVPATKEGVPAIQSLIAEGISINVTLIFSVERHKEVMNAYLAGLEKRVAEKKSLSGITSVASFFVSRVDTEIDRILGEKAKLLSGTEAEKVKNLSGKAAIANSKAAYAEFKSVFGSERFKKLKERGASLQRPLWASTSTKNPAYRDVLYVETLIGPDTVNTLPPATFSAFRDHGVAQPLLATGLDEAMTTLQNLKSVGIDLSRVTQDLEDAGVKIFSDAYKKIIQNAKSS